MSDLEIPDYLPKWITDHVKLYLENPEQAHLWDSSLGGGEGMLPTLLLITTGRKSGKRRPLPLIYKKVGGNYVIIASKGGAPAHPLWYLNLRDVPECEVRVASKQLTVNARTAEGQERKDLWAQLAEIYPPYNAYQETAGAREIPVVVLEPE